MKWYGAADRGEKTTAYLSKRRRGYKLFSTKDVLHNIVI